MLKHSDKSKQLNKIWCQVIYFIEAFGEKKEFDELKNLFKQLREKEGENLHPGVKTRTEWAFDRLKERGSGH